MGLKFYPTGNDYPIVTTFTLDAGTAHASYPLVNLNSRVRRKQFRTANGSATDIYIEFDFGVAVVCDSLILDGYFTNAADVNVHTGSTDNGSTWDELIVDSAVSAAAEQINLYSFTEKTKRYYRLRISNFAANGVDWIANAFICAEYETPRFNESVSNAYYTYDNVIRNENNVYAQRFKMGERRRVWENIEILGLTDAQKGTFEDTFDDNCQGLLRPFYAYDEDRSTLKFWEFLSQPVFTRQAGDLNSVRFGLLEQQ